MSETTAQITFEKISGAEKVPDKTSARNGLRHIVSLSMTKIADGLINPKLVLAWLLTSLGAPAVYAGALVPIREAGALLPQMPLAKVLQGMALRKWMWVIGSVGQGIAAGLIVLAALTLEGTAAGLAICGALAVLALCRAACSVSYKDILGKTVPKAQRGSVTGMAGSVSSVGVLVFAALLLTGMAQDRVAVVFAIGLAATLWAAAALLFSTMKEEQSDTQSNTSADFSVLKGNGPLQRFIIVRGLLVSTALAPPYLVVLASEGTLSQLGALVLASAAASLVSSYIWGRLSDRSSRQVLMLAGVLGAVAMTAAVLCWAIGVATIYWVMPAVLFILMIAYHGVRQARSTYLVDLAGENERAAFAAVSNTVIGTLLLVAGVVGGGAALIGAQATLIVFTAMAIAAAVVAYGLPEVEDAA